LRAVGSLIPAFAAAADSGKPFLINDIRSLTCWSVIISPLLPEQWHSLSFWRKGEGLFAMA
jgi:hypothetical protein